MATPIFRSGQGGTIELGSNTFNVTNWRMTIAAEAYDTTNTSSADFIGHDASGPTGASGSADAYWDSANLPTDSGGLDVQPGETFAATFNLGDSTLSYTMQIRIADITQVNEAKGIMTFSFNWVSTGEITFPT